jgi:hypothetical protein
MYGDATREIRWNQRVMHWCEETGKSHKYVDAETGSFDIFPEGSGTFYYVDYYDNNRYLGITPKQKTLVSYFDYAYFRDSGGKKIREYKNGFPFSGTGVAWPLYRVIDFGLADYAFPPLFGEDNGVAIVKDNDDVCENSNPPDPDYEFVYRP